MPHVLPQSRIAPTSSSDACAISGVSTQASPRNSQGFCDYQLGLRSFQSTFDDVLELPVVPASPIRGYDSPDLSRPSLPLGKDSDQRAALQDAPLSLAVADATYLLAGIG
eukprot:CAMPEP_0167810414 /NCGR_PEP_ID=MMETSP0112_2-20121227/71_1 /TAXON_ID=91324 /ORGANISM="Lotharella globosa, Strain CCCM811" /LENGTH=109 /DNA_ID=CAMNT_0007708955 /DNA_START=435 /DNA_END=764 /DNA_ORIENTATION=-